MQNDEAIARSSAVPGAGIGSARRGNKKSGLVTGSFVGGAGRLGRHRPATHGSRRARPARRHRYPAPAPPCGAASGTRISCGAPFVHGVAAPARPVRPLRPAHRRGPADAVVPGPRLRRCMPKRAPRRRPLHKSCRVEFYRLKASSRGRSCIERAAAASSGSGPWRGLLVWMVGWCWSSVALETRPPWR